MNRVEAIHGIIVPIITPMDAQERLDETGLKKQLDRMIDAGVHGIFCLGTNGEGFALNFEEKCRVIEVCAQHVAGRVPLFAGTGCITTAETIALSMHAQQAGADVLSVITPSFAALSQDQLFAHYQALTEAVSLPVLVYNIPMRTGVSVAPDTFARLARLDGIAGIKDSSGNFDNMLQYIERSRDTGCVVLSGNDSLILWNLLAGGAGGIAGCANVYPRTLVSIYEQFRAGNVTAARQAQDSIRSLRNCFRFGNPNTVIKLAVEMLGHPAGPCRRPFDSIAENGQEELRRVLVENQAKGMQ